MPKSRMQIVIMAAGLGQRLDSTQGLPKTMTPVGGAPLLSYILKGLSVFSNLDIFVVTGFAAPVLEDYIRRQPMPIRLVHNPDYTLGNLMSLMAVRPFLNDTFVVLNADHVFDRDILSLILKEPQYVSVVCDFDRSLSDDDMKMVKNEQGGLKSLSKKHDVYDGGYIGSTVVPASRITDYWKAADAVLSRQGTAIHVEAVLNELAALKEPISIIDASGHSWFEVDTPDDLVKAEHLISRMKF